MPNQKEFGPLMESIAAILTELEGKKLPEVDAKKVVELRRLYDEYFDCCCMDAQVIKGPAAR